MFSHVIDDCDSIQLTHIVLGNRGVAYSVWWLSTDCRARHCEVQIQGTGTVNFISDDPRTRQTILLDIQCLMRNKICRALLG